MTMVHEPSVGGYCDSEIYLECSCGWESRDSKGTGWSDHLPDSLDSAWAEVEAVLPEGAWLKIEGPHDAPHADWYTVEAVMWTEHTTKVIRLAKTEAPLPAALHALAANLRERAG